MSKSDDYKVASNFLGSSKKNDFFNVTKIFEKVRNNLPQLYNEINELNENITKMDEKSFSSLKKILKKSDTNKQHGIFESEQVLKNYNDNIKKDLKFMNEITLKNNFSIFENVISNNENTLRTFNLIKAAYQAVQSSKNKTLQQNFSNLDLKTCKEIDDSKALEIKKICKPEAHEPDKFHPLLNEKNNSKGYFNIPNLNYEIVQCKDGYSYLLFAKLRVLYNKHVKKLEEQYDKITKNFTEHNNNPTSFLLEDYQKLHKYVDSDITFNEYKTNLHPKLIEKKVLLYNYRNQNHAPDINMLRRLGVNYIQDDFRLSFVINNYKYQLFSNNNKNKPIELNYKITEKNDFVISNSFKYVHNKDDYTEKYPFSGYVKFNYHNPQNGEHHESIVFYDKGIQCFITGNYDVLFNKKLIPFNEAYKDLFTSLENPNRSVEQQVNTQQQYQFNNSPTPAQSGFVRAVPSGMGNNTNQMPANTYVTEVPYSSQYPTATQVPYTPNAPVETNYYTEQSNSYYNQNYNEQPFYNNQLPVDENGKEIKPILGENFSKHQPKNYINLQSTKGYKIHNPDSLYLTNNEEINEQIIEFVLKKTYRVMKNELPDYKDLSYEDFRNNNAIHSPIDIIIRDIEKAHPGFTNSVFLQKASLEKQYNAKMNIASQQGPAKSYSPTSGNSLSSSPAKSEISQPTQLNNQKPAVARNLNESAKSPSNQDYINQLDDLMKGLSDISKQTMQQDKPIEKNNIQPAAETQRSKIVKPLPPTPAAKKSFVQGISPSATPPVPGAKKGFERK